MRRQRPASETNAVSTHETIETTSAPSNAAPNVWTSRPGTILDVSQRQKAFRTKMKRPSVTSVSGSVKMSSTGRTMALMRPRTRAASRSGVRPVTTMPGTSWAATQRAAALTTRRRRKPTPGGSVAPAEGEPERAVDRQHAGAADEDRQRHGDEHEVELVAVALARRAGKVDEEAVPPVHLGDGHQHDHDESERGRPRQESDQHRQTAEKLDEGRRGGGGRRHAHAFERLDGRAEAVAAEPAEHLLSPMCEKDDTEPETDDEV